MSTTITAISQVLDALGRVPLIVSALTKGTLLILIAIGLTRGLGRAPAAARHLVWSLAVAGMLLLPATTLIPWRLELPALSAAREALDLTPATLQPNDTRGPVEMSRAPLPSSVQPRPATSTSNQQSAAVPQSAVRIDAATVLLLAWTAGLLWMLGRLVVGVLAIRRIVRSAVPADGPEWQSLVETAQTSLGARPTARLVISSQAAMPFTYGLLRPVIVLPTSAEQWTTDRRRSVLLHEFAHLRRRDLLTNAVVQLACAVYWFHPLVRLAGRRVRIEAERSCDALVVAAGTRPSDYAGDLLDIARTMRSSTTATVALAMARHSDFEGRLLAILAPDSGRNVLTAARAAIVALCFAVPAVAIAAAVPANHSVPNAVRTTDTRTDAGTPDAASAADGESVALTARIAAVVAQATSRDSQTPEVTQGRGDTAVPALLSVITDSSSAVRLAAVEALGNLSDPRAVDALVQALRTDTDAKVREAAAESLGEIDSPRAVPGLIAALGSERVAAVKAKIAWALGELDDARAVDALSAAVRDGEAEVRRQAVWALGEIEAAAGVPALLSVLRDPDVETRKQAVWALGEIESPEAITGVSAATKDADAEVRQQAVESLGNIADKRALPALEAATRDAEVEVRRHAVEAIGQLDELRSAPQALIAATRDADAEVRKSAAEALGQIEDEAAVPALIPLTRDANTEVKRSAVEALANIGGARAIEVMAALLKDEDPEIRKLAAEALGKK
jgi:HEAT repeat protein/beta-lactamase regulating signal transducer with metallopeptidase domain